MVIPKYPRKPIIYCATVIKAGNDKSVYTRALKQFQERKRDRQTETGTETERKRERKREINFYYHFLCR